MTQTKLPVEGMTCGHCVQSVTKALQRVPGVQNVEVSLEQRQARVEHDPNQVRVATLVTAIQQAGYEVPSATGEEVEATDEEPPTTRGTSAIGTKSGHGSVPPQKPFARQPLELPIVVAPSPTPRNPAQFPSKPASGPTSLLDQPPQVESLTLDIEGMHCASCIGRVEQALNKVPGVTAARANLATNQASVRFTNAPPATERLLAAVHDAGYEATVAQPLATGADFTAREEREAHKWRNRFLLSLVLLVPLMTVGYTPWAHDRWMQWMVLIIATILQVFVGGPYFVGAWKRLRHGSANMDTLVALGTGAAYGWGVVDFLAGTHGMTFMDGGMILTFITLGKWLEARAKGRASRAILKLLEMAPDTVPIQRGSQVVTLPVAEVRAGDTMVVHPGQRVALDGIVAEGFSDINEAWLTGESLPVEKRPGDPIYAGTTNGQGSLQARVTQSAGQTRLAQTIELVREAQESKAEVQQLADRVVAWFVPVVLVIAAITLIAWSLGAADGWRIGLSCAVAVLVVACPCAMGLATPAAVLVGSGRGAEEGILIKDARALEIAAHVKALVLDKTGTVTLGKPRVARILPASGVTESRLLAIAAAGERLSNHPLARAVVERAEQSHAERIIATSLRVIPGQGIEVQSAEGIIVIGTWDLLDSAGVSHPVADSLLQPEGGETVIHVGLDTQYLGTLALADTVAPGSREAIDQLRRQGLRVIMLSGDRQATAEQVAQQVGIDEVIAEVRPDQKQDVVRQLQQEGLAVAMVGDGINDAPALAAADLGIAIGAGADVAIESADVILARHDLRAIVTALSLSRHVLKTIRQNLVWAFLYNVLLIPLATGMFLPLWNIALPPALAAAAMALSSVSVVLNSLRLRITRL